MAETNGKLRYVPTTCPYCGVGCGLNLVVNDGKLVGVEPNKRSPINEGNSAPRGNLLGVCPESGSADKASHQEERQV